MQSLRWLSRYCYRAGFLRMMELAMTSFLPNDYPAIPPK